MNIGFGAHSYNPFEFTQKTPLSEVLGKKFGNEPFKVSFVVISTKQHTIRIIDLSNFQSNWQRQDDERLGALVESGGKIQALVSPAISQDLKNSNQSLSLNGQDIEIQDLSQEDYQEIADFGQAFFEECMRLHEDESQADSQEEEEGHRRRDAGLNYNRRFANKVVQRVLDHWYRAIQGQENDIKNSILDSTLESLEIEKKRREEKQKEYEQEQDRIKNQELKRSILREEITKEEKQTQQKRLEGKSQEIKATDVKKEAE